MTENDLWIAASAAAAGATLVTCDGDFNDLAAVGKLQRIYVAQPTKQGYIFQRPDRGYPHGAWGLRRALRSFPRRRVHREAFASQLLHLSGRNLLPSGRSHGTQ
jgi:hypothetical protein